MKKQIRLATIDDIKIYTDLLQQTYESAYTNNDIGLTKDCFSQEIFNTQNTQDYLKPHLINTDTQKTWLAFNNDKLIGSITCTITNKNIAELSGFYIHPNYQGYGLGKELYQLALEFGGERDFVLDIYTHNLKSIEIYQKWGWELDTSKGERGYFYRHWDEWPANLQAKCMYMRLDRRKITYNH